MPAQIPTWKFQCTKPDSAGKSWCTWSHDMENQLPQMVLEARFDDEQSKIEIGPFTFGCVNDHCQSTGRDMTVDNTTLPFSNFQEKLTRTNTPNGFQFRFDESNDTIDIDLSNTTCHMGKAAMNAAVTKTYNSGITRDPTPHYPGCQAQVDFAVDEAKAMVQRYQHTGDTPPSIADMANVYFVHDLQAPKT